MTESNDGIEKITKNLEIKNLKDVEDTKKILEQKTELKIDDEPSKRALLEKDIQKKIDAGENLSEKEIYTRIDNELAEKHGVNRTYAYKIRTNYIKKLKNKPIDSKVQSDKSTIIVQPVEKESRPLPKEKPKLEKIIPDSILDSSQVELQFNADMIEMSFENISEFEKMVGLPAPKIKKIKRMAHTIALYNQKMIQAGKPDKVIDLGDKMLEIMIKVGIVGLFLQPIGEKFLKPKEKNDGITKKEPLAQAKTI